LALTNGGNEVDDASRHIEREVGSLEAEFLIWEQRGEIFKATTLAGLFWIKTVDFVDSQQRRIFLGAVCRTTCPFEHITLAKSELASLFDRDVDVVTAGEIPLDPEEPVALISQVQEPCHWYWFAFEGSVLEIFWAVTVATPATPTSPVAFITIALLEVLTALAALLVTTALAALLVPTALATLAVALSTLLVATALAALAVALTALLVATALLVTTALTALLAILISAALAITLAVPVAIAALAIALSAAIAGGIAPALG
jgi:hypothetical protein